ncbi:Sugar transporter [Operophtera brumata]|uniref:Sugar transporter n=1 Tax=Operophtera brumata TaxID=104452 RepID=A0A0L7KPS3_OPEBR|nr:Sugar transporter [Operophtera brumata]
MDIALWLHPAQDKLVQKTYETCLCHNGCLLASAACCVCISVYASAYIPASVRSYDPDTFVNQKDIMPVVLFLLLVCFYGLGLPWVLLSEVFPFSFFFLATKTNINLDETFHLSGTYAIYASFGVVGSIYLYFFLPETENKSLVEIEAFYKGDQIIFADDSCINFLRKKKGKKHASCKWAESPFNFRASFKIRDRASNIDLEIVLPSIDLEIVLPSIDLEIVLPSHLIVVGSHTL